MFENLHQKLMVNFAWYQKWHKFRYVSLIHTGIFIIALLITFTLALYLKEIIDSFDFLTYGL